MEPHPWWEALQAVVYALLLSLLALLVGLGVTVCVFTYLL